MVGDILFLLILIPPKFFALDRIRHVDLEVEAQRNEDDIRDGWQIWYSERHF